MLRAGYVGSKGAFPGGSGGETETGQLSNRANSWPAGIFSIALSNVMTAFSFSSFCIICMQYVYGAIFVGLLSKYKFLHHQRECNQRKEDNAREFRDVVFLSTQYFCTAFRTKEAVLIEMEPAVTAKTSFLREPLLLF